MTTYNYQQTKYPELFKNTYWGNFVYETTFKQMILNRNMLAENLNLTEHITNPKKFHQLRNTVKDFQWDHCEFYKDKNKQIVFLNSPYSSIDQPIITKYYHKIIEPIYTPNAITLLSMFPNIRKFNKWCNDRMVDHFVDWLNQK